jgi:hypothetical protein
LVNPKAFLSARLRLLELADSSGFSNHFSQPLAFLYCLLQQYVPAVRSTLPENCLPERSSIQATFFFISFCKLMIGEKLLLIQRPFRFQFGIEQPRFLSVSCFFESTLN